ncbi:uncharacterized protein LOC113295619 [Papaver somniferum]|uniref:uncharacterized protein LOC113295619 n=1 Tax=Papaver somniferum TaxID=3469 RepID=UPI000E6FA6DD|nr:uncharacterized protein LOC113295619 [Papaver somniferum]
MRVLFWNINGIVRDEVQFKLKELVKSFKPDIIGIAKPRVVVSSRSMRHFKIDGFNSSIIHNSTESSIGNLWVMWSLNYSEPVVLNMSRQAITIDVDGVYISMVDASSIQTTRRNFWRQLDMGAQQVQWLVIGDFNCILRNGEKKGGATPRTEVINEFSDWLDDNSLFEADALGSKFTWSNKQSGARRIICKLDRAVINDFWFNRFENWRCKSLPREVPDRSTLVGYPFINTRPRRAPFRVQKMWFLHADFMRMVRDSWNAPLVGSPDFIFPQKLKRLKVKMKLWNQIVFGNVHVKLKQEELRLEGAIRVTDEDPFNVEKKNHTKDAQVEVNDICMQLVTMLKQKSRNQWLMEGASNTNFFHNSIRMRRSSNTISELVNDTGITINDYDQICDMVVNYYQAKFNGDNSVLENSLFDIEHDRISVEESNFMDRLPSMEEIHEAVFDLGEDNASGTDGFAGFFYKHCWEIISEDLVKSIFFCWTNKFIPHGVNSSLLLFLPKERGANTIKNYSFGECPG